MARKSWRPLPAITLLAGDADFFKRLIFKRFTEELFGDAKPEISSFQATPGERQAQEPPLAKILDELRTPSFFSAHRIVTLEHGNAFLTAHGETLTPFLEKGFAGGHFIVFVDGKLDGRTRLAKAMAKAGWVVDCAQPYDRPPPWERHTPVWDSELTHWIVAHAQKMGLEIDPQTAFLLHQRAGTELALLSEELEKIATYLRSKGSKTVEAKAVTAVVGDLREDSVFQAIELFLEGRQVETLSAVGRLFAKGYHTSKGAVTDPTSISLLLSVLSCRAFAPSGEPMPWRPRETDPMRGRQLGSYSVRSSHASSETFVPSDRKKSPVSLTTSTSSTSRSSQGEMRSSSWRCSSSSLAHQDNEARAGKPRDHFRPVPFPCGELSEEELWSGSRVNPYLSIFVSSVGRDISRISAARVFFQPASRSVE